MTPASKDDPEHGFDHLICHACWVQKYKKTPPYLETFEDGTQCCWCGRFIAAGIEHWSVWAPYCDA